MRRKAMKPGFLTLNYVPAGWKPFSLGRTVAITDNASTKTFAFPAEERQPEQRIPGTAPDDDPA
jgi:hypothetical protein